MSFESSAERIGRNGRLAGRTTDSGKRRPERAPRQRRFGTTRWSLVRKAAGADGGEAASRLCRAYWEPVFQFFRRQGADEDEAKDITQGFFAKLHGQLAKADPARGHFRSWLCRCAKNYLYNVRDHERALYVGGGQAICSLDDQRAGLVLPGEWRSPEQLLNHHWALVVIDRALSRLREHYAELGQRELFQSLEGTLTGEGSELSDAELSRVLGKPQGAVRVERCRMKKSMSARFRRYLRAEIAETVTDPEQVDDEIHELLAALS